MMPRLGVLVTFIFLELSLISSKFQLIKCLIIVAGQSSRSISSSGSGHMFMPSVPEIQLHSGRSVKHSNNPRTFDFILSDADKIHPFPSVMIHGILRMLWFILARRNLVLVFWDRTKRKQNSSSSTNFGNLDPVEEEFALQQDVSDFKIRRVSETDPRPEFGIQFWSYILLIWLRAYVHNFRLQVMCCTCTKFHVELVETGATQTPITPSDTSGDRTTELIRTWV